MTAEIDEDGVEIAGYDVRIDVDDLRSMKAEIERLRAENREHALSELVALGQAEEAYGAQLAAEARIAELEAVVKSLSRLDTQAAIDAAVNEALERAAKYHDGHAEYPEGLIRSKDGLVKPLHRTLQQKAELERTHARAIRAMKKETGR